MKANQNECKCPNCGMRAHEETETKPFNYTSITCYNCGLVITPEVKYMSLEKLNSIRENLFGAEALKELPEQKKNLLY